MKRHYVLRNTTTNEDYAYHIENGATLNRWKQEAEKETGDEFEIVLQEETTEDK